MEVILLERVPNLGAMGELVNVRTGYARNFLIPQRKALRATEANKAVFSAKRAEMEAENAARKAEAEKLATKLEGASVTVVRQASEDGKLYGSVVARDVAVELEAQGHRVDRKTVALTTSIKNIGAYTATVTLHPEVVVNVTVNVSRSETGIAAEAAA